MNQIEEENKLPLLEQILMGWLLVGFLISVVLSLVNIFYALPLKEIWIFLCLVPLCAEGVASQVRMERRSAI